MSQILNGSSDRFPEETRGRVLRAAAELNYRPSRMGRALKRGVSDVVILIVPNATYGHHFQDTIDKLASESERRGLSVLVRYAGRDPRATLATVLDMMPAAVVDMGVFDDADRAEIVAAGIDIIPDFERFSRDMFDPNRHIGALQAGHLLRDPSLRLAYALLDDARDDPFGPGRLAGAVAEAAAHGRAAPAVIHIPLRRDEARQILGALVGDDPGLRWGICCYNDEVGIAVLTAAAELGLSVPDQVAVVGADATEIGQLVTPPLTTIAIDTPAIMETFGSWFAPFESPHQDAAPPPIEGFVTLVQGRTT